MTNYSETLSIPLEDKRIGALQAVSKVSTATGIQFMVFGAFARDVHFHYARGIDITRETADVDISIQVKDWDAYNTFVEAIEREGFEEESSGHPEKRVHKDTGQEIDLLPFGEIAEDNKVTWPVDGTPWSVIGFDEAFAGADWLEIPDGEEGTYQIAVAPIPALVVLKLVAICDRPEVRHKKDAVDISFILKHYIDKESKPLLLDDNAWIIDEAGDDLELATAMLLGSDIARFVSDKTAQFLTDLLRHDVNSQSRCFVVRGLTKKPYREFSRARQLVEAILKGMTRHA